MNINDINHSNYGNYVYSANMQMLFLLLFLQGLQLLLYGIFALMFWVASDLGVHQDAQIKQGKRTT